MLRKINWRPGMWQIERRGASGTRYRLRFCGTRFDSMSQLHTYAPGTPYASQYWRRVYTMPAPPLHNPRPRGKLVCACFRDLGLPVNSFCAGRHVRFTVSD